MELFVMDVTGLQTEFLPIDQPPTVLGMICQSVISKLRARTSLISNVIKADAFRPLERITRRSA
jgi:hypothetical protein